MGQLETIFEQDNYMLTFINGFEKGEPDYVLAIDNPTRFYKAKFEKNEDDNFVLKFTVPQEEFDVEYFLKRPAVLRAPGFIDIFLMTSDAIAFSQTLSSPQQVEVTYKGFSTEIDPALWSQSKHCAYFRYSKKDFQFTKLGLHFELTTLKNQDSSWRNAFALRVSSDNEILVSFEEMIPGDDAYCVFRSQKAMSYELFEKHINAVRTVIGILSGYYLGKRSYFLSDYTKNPPNNRTPLIVRYNNTSKSLHHDYPILDTTIYQDLELSQLQITAPQFDKLIRLLVNKEDYQRALRLLIDASATDGPSRGAIAAVALEAIANELAEKGTGSLIIQETKVASQLKHELRKVLKVIKPHITKEEYNKIESKIGAVNNQPNAVKLESCFEKVGIKLSDEEVFCISCRNSFLHGGLPNNEALRFLNKNEMVFMVSHRLIMLSAMLLLKQAGYNGLVNDWGYTVVIKRRAIREGNPYLHSGNAHRKIN